MTLENETIYSKLPIPCWLTISICIYFIEMFYCLEQQNWLDVVHQKVTLNINFGFANI